MLSIEDKDWMLVKRALLAWKELSGVEIRLYISQSEGSTRNWMTADIFLNPDPGADDETLKTVAPAVASVVRTRINNFTAPFAEHAHDLTWFGRGETNELLRPLPFPVRVEVTKKKGGAFKLDMRRNTTLEQLIVPRLYGDLSEVQQAIFRITQEVRGEGRNYLTTNRIQYTPEDLGDRSFFLFISR